MRDIDLSYLGASRPLECGDRVEKTSGYRFPGIIVSVFETTAGRVRYVVEAEDPNFEGMLHIFNGDQLCRRALSPGPDKGRESASAAAVAADQGDQKRQDDR